MLTDCRNLKAALAGIVFERRFRVPMSMFSAPMSSKLISKDSFMKTKLEDNWTPAM